MSVAPLLLIEDTPSLQIVYRSVLEAAGYRVTVAGDAAQGLTVWRAEAPSVVLLDLMLPDRDGLSLMHEMIGERPGVRVVVITSNGSINKAVEAMRAGAHDFLVKPFDERRFLGAVENALRAGGPAPAAALPRAAAPVGGFIGTSPPMRAVYDKIVSVARSMATVFITGESGTGKEIAAQAIHDLSPRARAPFIALNCGAIPSDLLESEVFGHVRGAFTGAIGDKPGAAQAADGGTLFLDEICEMDLALQPKLLRFLQTSAVTPVGATKPRKVDVRIVCATNRDPLEAVRRGTFREDLYYRLFVVPIHLPPLRERGDDAIEIAEAALRRFAREEGRGFTAMDDSARAAIRAMRWPGNVRQLLNVIRNVVVLNDAAVLTAAMLPGDHAQPAAAPAPPPMAEPRPAPPSLDRIIEGRTLAEIEQMVIEAAIARAGGSIPAAARALGVAPSTLYRKREAWAGRRA
jgi:DNA-binding NtrC family response regulator